tara:strand:- start:104 stop:295 length:192 start_codon:yes stop_codon:yes gene_type:complete
VDRYRLPLKQSLWELSKGLEGISEGDVVVDLGCGSGDFLALVKEKVRSAILYGIDWHIPNPLA